MACVQGDAYAVVVAVVVTETVVSMVEVAGIVVCGGRLSKILEAIIQGP
jgi:hypothetical protein